MEYFVKVTHKVANLVGSDAAIIYAHLLLLYKTYYKPKGIIEFFQNQNQLLEALPWINKHSLKKAIKILSENNMIQIKRKGVNNQNFFTIIENENQWVKNEPSKPTGGLNENPPVGQTRTRLEKIKRIDKEKKEKTLEDPSESITHERTSEELDLEYMLSGDWLNDAVFKETPYKTTLVNSVEKSKTLSDTEYKAKYLMND